MSRQSKTPAQRAQEAVDVLERRQTRRFDQRNTIRQQLADIDTELRDIERRLEHALQNPDLPAQPTTTEETTE